MKNKTTIRTSIHADEQIWLRNLFATRRKELGLSQKGLAKNMGVIASFIGKVETGDRRLDIFEFMRYCQVLELEPIDVMQELKNEITKIYTH